MGDRDLTAGSVHGLTILVTGGGRGLGRAFAESLARAGARVVITGRTETTLVRTCAEFAADGLRVGHAVADMSVPGAMTQAVAHVERTVGPLDVLVNNAAVPSPTGPAWELDPAVWWNSVQTNVHGTYLSTRAALTVMVPRRHGRVVTVVSHAGKAVWPHVSAYSVAKAAIIKLTENVAAETRSHGVSMFAYHPGLMDIGMSRQNAIDALTGNEWDRKVAAWFAKVKANGGLTPVPLACAVLVRLAGGGLDALSGRYVTVDDDLDALLAEAARPAAR